MPCGDQWYHCFSMPYCGQRYHCVCSCLAVTRGITVSVFSHLAVARSITVTVYLHLSMISCVTVCSTSLCPATITLSLCPCPCLSIPCCGKQYYWVCLFMPCCDQWCHCVFAVTSSSISMPCYNSGITVSIHALL